MPTPLLAFLCAIVLATPSLIAWALAYPQILGGAVRWVRGYHAQMRAYVEAQSGTARPQITYLRSKDGTIPLVRLPSGQLRSLKKLSRRTAAHA